MWGAASRRSWAKVRCRGQCSTRAGGGHAPAPAAHPRPRGPCCRAAAPMGWVDLLEKAGSLRRLEVQDRRGELHVFLLATVLGMQPHSQLAELHLISSTAIRGTARPPRDRARVWAEWEGRRHPCHRAKDRHPALRTCRLGAGAPHSSAAAQSGCGFRAPHLPRRHLHPATQVQPRRCCLSLWPRRRACRELRAARPTRPPLQPHVAGPDACAHEADRGPRRICLVHPALRAGAAGPAVPGPVGCALSGGQQGAVSGVPCPAPWACMRCCTACTPCMEGCPRADGNAAGQHTTLPACRERGAGGAGGGAACPDGAHWPGAGPR